MAGLIEVPMEETELAPGILFPMGEQAVQWRVLDINLTAMTALVIADKPICEKAYDRHYAKWVHSVHKWLNGTYLQKTFSEEERSAILETELPGVLSGREGVPDGDTVRVRLFLPSEKEVRKYFKKKVDRDVGAAWGLRDLREYGGFTEYSAIVMNDGTIMTYNLPYNAIGVRPMFRIDLQSKFFRKFIFSEECGTVKLRIPQINILGNRLVSGCADIEELFVPDGIEKLGTRCLENMQDLKSVSLPASVKRIEKDALPGSMPVSLEGLTGMEKAAAIYAAMYRTSDWERVGAVRYIHWSVRGEESEPADREQFLTEFLQRAEKEEQWYIPYAVYADEKRVERLLSLMEEWRKCWAARDLVDRADAGYQDLIIRVRGALLLNDTVSLIPPAERFRVGVRFPFGMGGHWWRVLDVDTETMTALVIADDVVSTDHYDRLRFGEATIWSNCTLRVWLNDEFLSKNFTKEEQAAMLQNDTPNPANPNYRTIEGENTTDKLFLLSLEEMQRYLPQKTDRILFSGSGWWLRTPGNCRSNAACINSSGSISYAGKSAYDTDSGVRPAFRLNLNSEAFRSLRQKEGGNIKQRAAIGGSLSDELGIEMFN